MATHSSILTWRLPRDRVAWPTTVHKVSKSWTQLKQLSTAQHTGIYPKKTKTLIQKDTCTPMLRAALFIRTKIWKQPKCPSRDEWLKKVLYVCINTHTHTPWNVSFEKE